MGDWIVLIDEGDVAEELGVVDEYIKTAGLSRKAIKSDHSDPRDHKRSRAWLVRYALEDIANNLQGVLDLDGAGWTNPAADDEHEIVAAEPVRPRLGRGRGKLRGAR